MFFFFLLKFNFHTYLVMTVINSQTTNNLFIIKPRQYTCL